MDKDIQIRFQRLIAGAFFVGILILVFGQDIRSGLAVIAPGDTGGSPTDTGQPPQTQTPTQTTTPPPVEYKVQVIPTEFKPTAIPPGNNVAGPLNTSAAPQIKSGDLTIQGALSAASSVDVTGNLTVSGAFNLQGHNIKIASVPSTPVYQTSYGNWVQGSSQPDDSCNGDSTNSYTCVPGVTKSSCRDKISYQGGAHNSFTFFQHRTVSCWTEYNMINTLIVE
ncbi:MAG TPA: hypothetical protein VJH70_02385 [Candidatus Paceibacterota bacterium]